MIYCVEDDAGIRDLIVYTLQSTGFKAKGFQDGKAFLEALEASLPSLVILDIMLPGKDGISILKALKSDTRTKAIPVIMSTAKGTEYDKVLGLDSGADDYIAKPFGMMELVSRVRAVMRRSDPKEKENDIAVGDITINPAKHLVSAGGKDIVLTLKEFELLLYLMEHRGFVMTRNTLLEALWGYDFGGETRTVDVHIRTLRQKLGEHGDIIETVRGVGYKIGGVK